MGSPAKVDRPRNAKTPARSAAKTPAKVSARSDGKKPAPLSAPVFHNFIAGRWGPAASGATFEDINPADTSDIVGRFPRSGQADVDAAVRSAQRGFERWSRTPAPARGDVLRRVGEILVARKEEIANLMTREMGKPLAETRGDVQEGIDTAFYAATMGRQLFGRTVPSELRAKWAMSYRRPIGVCGIVTPFNFPLAIPTWKMFPALVCGNACVFKPAEDVPHTGAVFVEILLEA
jgi:acyl-CoA reductase-like NAD-dependent aldehyde dehydrogenase